MDLLRKFSIPQFWLLLPLVDHNLTYDGEVPRAMSPVNVVAVYRGMLGQTV